MELAKAVIDGFHSSSEVEMQRDKKEDTAVCYLDTTKAKNDFGFVCQYSLSEAFGELCNEK